MSSKEWGPGVAPCLGCGLDMLPDYRCRVCLGNIHWYCGVETFEEDPPGHGAHYLCKGCQEKSEGRKNTKSSAAAAQLSGKKKEAVAANTIASAAQLSEKKKTVAGQQNEKKTKAVAPNKKGSKAKRNEEKKEAVAAQSSSDEVSMEEVVNTSRCINRNCPLSSLPPCQSCYRCGGRCHVSCSKIIGKNYYCVVCCPIVEAVQRANDSHSLKRSKKRKALTMLLLC